MNNLTGFVILTGTVIRPAGTMQRRLLAPLPPGVTAGGTQAEPGEFPRTERRGAASPRRCPCSRRPRECAAVLCLLRCSVMGMTGCLLACRELMGFTIHYRYIALEKKKKNLTSTPLSLPKVNMQLSKPLSIIYPAIIFICVSPKR